MGLADIVINDQRQFPWTNTREGGTDKRDDSRLQAGMFRPNGSVRLDCA